jgi:GNAT superfamily N-acetyltransferase
MGVTVRMLVVEETYDLRRDVLRGGASGAVVHYPTDDHPSTWHFGATDEDGNVVATSTYFAEPCPLHPDVGGAIRLRSMAVAPGHQGQGLGAVVLERALERLGERGASLVWANARDGALGFYARCGFEVTGRSFVEAETGLDHTVVVRSLR